MCAVVVALSVVVVGSPVAAEDPPAVPPLVAPRTPIAEGHYLGTLQWPQGSYRFASGPTQLASQWNLSGGVVELQVVGTTVTGSWSFDMASVGSGTSSQGRSGSGEALIHAEGILEGDANSVCMAGSMAVEGSITVEDPSGSLDVPISETLPLSCADLGWDLATSTCTSLSGEWTVPLGDSIRLTGASFPTDGTFALVRVGDAVSELTEDLDVDALLVEMERIVNSEPFDGPALGRVLRRLAEFEGNNALNVRCEQRDPENTRIAGAFLYRLLIDRFLQDRPSDLATLRWMAYAALNTGLIGSASTQPERAAALEANFTQELMRLTQEAIDSGDELQLARLSAFAGQYGWDQIEAVADAAYEQMRGGR